MKIVSWNANGRFRDKYESIIEEQADVYVIMECENPATSKNAAYRDFFKNYYWTGQIQYKGLMVFTLNPSVKIELLDWHDGGKRYFIPVRVNDSFTLVGAWACNPYCQELQDWVEAVGDHITSDTIIMGDLNSNVIFDPENIKKSGKSFGHVLEMIKPKGLEGMWHRLHKEKHGEERTPTFFLYRHLNNPFHIDHCLASPELVSLLDIRTQWQWLSLSDHLPLVAEVNI